jgi:hypothetical protein
MRGRIKVSELTHARLIEVLDYNADTGDFFWKISPSKNLKVGDLAGGKKKQGFRYITVDGTGYTAPRLAWYYVTGQWPKYRVGFKNRDTNDCRFENLYVFNGVGTEFDHKTEDGRVAYHRFRRQVIEPRRSDKELRRCFGIGLETYSVIADTQGGRCAICLQPEKSMVNGRYKALAVDHCHKTGKVRGLLCSDCNTGIGKLKDDPQVILSAYRYLIKHSLDAVIVSEEQPGNLAPSTGPADTARTTGRNLVQEV